MNKVAEALRRASSSDSSPALSVRGLRPKEGVTVQLECDAVEGGFDFSLILENTGAPKLLHEVKLDEGEIEILNDENARVLTELLPASLVVIESLGQRGLVRLISYAVATQAGFLVTVTSIHGGEVFEFGVALNPVTKIAGSLDSETVALFFDLGSYQEE
jgi:hypothetical protein